jgi:hypothetical protein
MILNLFDGIANTASSIARQLETAELELADIRQKYESKLTYLREVEAKVQAPAKSERDLTCLQEAEKDEMIRLLDQQCALYERLLPVHAIEKSNAGQPATRVRKQAGKTLRVPGNSD